MGTRPFVIDTDVDIDDWMAILYLLNHEDVDVQGITVVGTGAAHLDPGARNALDLLMLADQPDVPVAKGLDTGSEGGIFYPTDDGRRPVDIVLGLADQQGSTATSSSSSSGRSDGASALEPWDRAERGSVRWCRASRLVALEWPHNLRGQRREPASRPA